MMEAFFIGAKDEIRTRDPNLGKVVLYQLSYFRVDATKVKHLILFCKRKIKKISI